MEIIFLQILSNSKNHLHATLSLQNVKYFSAQHFAQLKEYYCPEITPENFN
jgi:hypothetical protein